MTHAKSAACGELMGVAMICLFGFLCRPLGVFPAIAVAFAIGVACYAVVAVLKSVCAAWRTSKETRQDDSPYATLDRQIAVLSTEVESIKMSTETLALLAQRQAPMLSEMHSAFLAAQAQRRQQR